MYARLRPRKLTQFVLEPRPENIEGHALHSLQRRADGHGRFANALSEVDPHSVKGIRPRNPPGLVRSTLSAGASPTHPAAMGLLAVALLAGRAVAHRQGQ